MTWMNRLRELGGAATTHQLRMAGATPEDLKRAVRGGAVDRVRRGVYVSPLLDGVALEAVRAGARVSLADCLRSVARCADEETAVAAFDTALTAGLVSPSGLRRILEAAPRDARERAALARPGSDSGVESLVRQRLERGGHRVEQQVHVRGVGRVDMRIDGELYLEVDGYAFHSDAGAFERDRLRDSTLAELGHRRLRVTARQVAEDWPRVEAAIDRIVQRA